jgi:ArsR family transcriptional regulator, arsenate/arsenite/antimonite-responsive transcriptional repressor
MNMLPMKSFLRVMKALSDPNRVRIVKLLQHKTMCVCELQSLLEIAQQTVSKHLKILEKAGLVSFKRDGLWVDYYPADGASSPYASSIMGNLKHWLEDDPDLSKIIARLPAVRREDICKR